MKYEHWITCNASNQHPPRHLGTICSCPKGELEYCIEYNSILGWSRTSNQGHTNGIAWSANFPSEEAAKKALKEMQEYFNSGQLEYRVSAVLKKHEPVTITNAEYKGEIPGTFYWGKWETQGPTTKKLPYPPSSHWGNYVYTESVTKISIKPRQLPLFEVPPVPAGYQLQWRPSVAMWGNASPWMNVGLGKYSLKQREECLKHFEQLEKGDESAIREYRIDCILPVDQWGSKVGHNHGILSGGSIGSNPWSLG